MSKKFEENYFGTHYAKIVGNFERSALEKNRRWLKGWLDFINRYIPLYKGSGKTMLEIGCAIAAPSSLLIEKGYKGYATDVSKLAVKEASRNLPDIKFAVWDVQRKDRFPFKKKFDVILGFEVIEHLPHPEKAITNFHSLLNKGGWLVLSTPYPYKKSFQDPTHVNVRYPEEWVEVLKKCGFKKFMVKEASFIPYLYKYSDFFSRGFPVGVPFPYINSTVFLLAKRT